MPITGWIAILVLIVMCYMLIKQYETRMVLFGGGFILCCISLTPMAGLNAFAKTMTNGALIMAICSATGFAYCVTFTECDRSLVHYLTRPIRNVGILMIPITSLGTTHYTTGAGNIKRFNMFNSATISGEAAHGYSSGQAMGVLEELVRRSDGYHGLPAFSGLVSQCLRFRHGSYVHHGLNQLPRHLLLDDRCGRCRRPVHCLLGFGRQQRRKNR